MSLDAKIGTYFKAWNAHDATQVAALFETNGAFEDPMSRMAMRSSDIEAASERGVAEWILTGSNSKPLKPGINATGRSLHLRGVEIFEGSSVFTRVTRYFDQVRAVRNASRHRASASAHA